MKKMGLAVAIFFGVILLTSTVVIALPGLMTPIDDNPDITRTGTPADNYPEAQRPQYCGTGEAKQTTFVKEYKIPTACTNPLAITTDYDGNVWFAQSNTGNIAKFDPITESFTEFDNPIWPEGGRTMMWGMDYAPDGSIWYTDDIFNIIWKFSTIDESYTHLGYSEGEDALLQKIQVFGSSLILNDFTGGKLVVLTPTEDNASMFSIPPILNGSVASDFASDAEKNIWFTSWVVEDSGVLVKFGYDRFLENPANTTLTMGDIIRIFDLPDDATTINGVEYHEGGGIWMVDTSSSFFFMFDPITNLFTKFVTSDPDPSTYGNATGVYKSTPTSRPYWIESTDDGRLVFNEHNANRIAVFDPYEESLIEYMVPSKNPNWADCLGMEDCGVSQVFGITVDKQKIWFTEWAENNIGVIDMSNELPFEIMLEQDSVSVTPGDSENIVFVMTARDPQVLSELPAILVSSNDSLDIVIGDTESDHGIKTVTATIHADSDAVPGQYKVLLGASTDEVSISKFLTVTVRT